MDLILISKIEMFPKGNSEWGTRAQKKYLALSPRVQNVSIRVVTESMLSNRSIKDTEDSKKKKKKD